ncbi:hypothetical protein BDF22DRAFT_736437 [Syncephalis plumigaleata]|nr:hypothetical protein BDF22DRAFT_736437 [Syncephalis plumigaleata]
MDDFLSEAPHSLADTRRRSSIRGRENTGNRSNIGDDGNVREHGIESTPDVTIYARASNRLRYRATIVRNSLKKPNERATTTATEETSEHYETTTEEASWHSDIPIISEENLSEPNERTTTDTEVVSERYETTTEEAPWHSDIPITFEENSSELGTRDDDNMSISDPNQDNPATRFDLHYHKHPSSF